MITASSSVDDILPGSVSAIATVVDTLGASINPALAVGNSWKAMSLPAWHGQAGTQWASFVPRETAATGKAPAALNRAATAMLRYQSAFLTARSQIQEAINEAGAAQKATQTAKQEYRAAVRKAASAPAGSPAAKVAAFTDPGAPALAAAQSKAQTALTTFQNTADEVASELRAAAGETSGQDSHASWWDQVLEFPGKIAEGFVLQGWSTLVGVWDMLPFGDMFDNVFNHHSQPWWQQYGDMWAGAWNSVTSDPGGAISALWNDFIGSDIQDTSVPDRIGAILANILMLAPSGIGALKGFKALDDAGDAAKAAKGLKDAKILKDGEQFNPDGTLKPNITYQSGEFDYIYTTDEHGYISSFRTDNLQLTERDSRLNHNPNTPGKEPGDQAGHLAGDQFGGSPPLDNLVSQLKSVNLSEYKKIENQWAKALNPDQPGGPKKVTVDVNIKTDPKTGRPTEFDVKYTIGNDKYSKVIPNN